MTARPELVALIERLEAATEGSRELDALVEVACPSITDWPAIVCDFSWEFVADEDGSVSAFIIGPSVRKKFKRFPSAHYTTSLDAALTLVPEGLAWQVNRAPSSNECRAEVDFSNGVWAPSAPLALCIASLRARSEADHG